jgi:hypothetical protein
MSPGKAKENTLLVSFTQGLFGNDPLANYE